MVEETARLERERAFHDGRFTDETRTALAKYYSVTRGSQQRFDAMLEAIPPGGRALELGCGLDGEALRLAERGIHVDVIDISPVAIEDLRRRAGRAGLDDLVQGRVMNAEKLDFPDSSFDAVFGAGILHHLDLGDVYAELSRVMAPSGFAVFTEPLGHNPAVNFYRRFTPKMRTSDEHPLVRGDFVLARRWFSTVVVTYFHAFTLLAVPARRSERFPDFLDRLERIDAALFQKFPPMTSLAWMCVVGLARPRTDSGG